MATIPSGTVRPGQSQAIKATSFLDSIGINAHMGWLDSQYSNVATVISDLQYLGIHNVRDTIGASWAAQRFTMLGNAGIKMDFFVPNVVDGVAPGQELNWMLQQVHNLAWMTKYIEGPNEVDFWPVTHDGLTGYAAVAAVMKDLQTQVKADPALAAIPILQYTLGNYNDYTGRQDLSAYADFATEHYYSGNADAPGKYVLYTEQIQRPVGGNDPVITTEGGYGTSSAPGYGRLSELAQAKYIPELLAEQYRQGVRGTYLYQLLDPYAGANPSTDFFNYYGLFRTDGTAKPAATAVHNLTSYLADTAPAGFSPGTLTYDLRNAPTSVSDMLLEKSNGTFELMLWNDVQSYDPTTSTDIVIPPASVGIDFPTAPQSIVMHDTLTGATQTITAAQLVNVLVPDHVIVLDIKPGVAPAPPVTIGSGPDALVMQISEDAYKGDAQFTVLIDGKQVGGVQTAQAAHAAGKTQAFSFLGSFTPGTHTVAVNFLNNLYEGNSASDRNLYVTSATFDNTVVSGATLTEYVNGPQSFNFLKPGTGGAPPVSVGSGPDSLVLKVSEDAYLGNATFTIAIDGIPIGGTLTALASHAAAQTQTFSVLGTFAAGNHTATINFLNDAYGGSSATDRNLYVQGATLNGTAIAGSVLTEYASGPRSFTFISTGHA